MIPGERIPVTCCMLSLKTMYKLLKYISCIIAKCTRQSKLMSRHPGSSRLQNSAHGSFACAMVYFLSDTSVNFSSQLHNRADFDRTVQRVWDHSCQFYGFIQVFAIEDIITRELLLRFGEW